MHKSIQLHWIEHAEGRSVREHAGLRRAASEPHVEVVRVTTGLAWFHRARALARALGRTVAAGIWAKADSGAVVKNSYQDSSVSQRSRGLRLVKLGFERRSKSSTMEVDYDRDRVLVAVLITDIVDSTRWAAMVGDHNWRVLLDRHDDATRFQIKRFGGREVGSRGDGFVGIFDSPSRAVRCASAIVDTIAPLGLLLRSGVHAGEVHLKDDEISGIAVHIAARIAATARPGEACVSRTVRDLVAGSGLVFEDRGIHQLRNLPEEIHLYAIRGLDTPPTSILTIKEPDAYTARSWDST